jgi:peptidoglycan/LPS O-acetylase OafA/YrhL
VGPARRLVGVDVFFVISGFSSAGSSSAPAEGDASIADFYARRIRRIFLALSPVLVKFSAVVRPPPR